MDFSNYIFRSHMVGDIINVPKPLTEKQRETLEAYRERMNGEGRPLTEKQKADWHSLENKLNQSKVYKLTDGQKKILRNLVFQTKYSYQDYPNADQMEKGLLVEKESRDLMSEVLGVLLVASKERRSNDWVTGKMDIEPNNLILDIKSAFTRDSFATMLDEDYKENERNLRQADCYMELWGLNDAVICHVLVDTPISIIEKKIRQLFHRETLFNSITNNFTDEGMQVVQGIVTNHIVTEKGMDDFCNYGFQLYSDHYLEFTKDQFPEWNELPKSERIHMIHHSFKKERIEQRNECIIIAREYMNTVKPINNLINIA